MHDSSSTSLATHSGVGEGASPTTESNGGHTRHEGGTCWPRLTIVTSLYKSARYIKEFHARHVACLTPLGIDFDFVFVNDGSPDDSEVVVRQLMEQHPAITL